MSCCNRPIELARHGTIRIERCGCGVIHLAIGHTTLRLDDDSFLQVAGQVHLAAEALSARHLLLGDRPSLELLHGGEEH